MDKFALKYWRKFLLLIYDVLACHYHLEELVNEQQRRFCVIMNFGICSAKLKVND